MSTLFATTTDPPATPCAYARVVPHRGIESAGRRRRQPSNTQAGTGNGTGAGTAAGGGSGGAQARDEDGLTYAIPPDTTLRPGQIVVVPLGRSDTPTNGVVTEVGGGELLGDLPPHRAKAILKVSEAVLTPALMDLARWMAGYYICPLGMVLASMIPAAVSRQVGRKSVTFLRRAEVSAIPAGGALSAADEALRPRLRKVWERVAVLPEGVWPLTPRALSDAVEGLSTAGIRRLVEAGLLTATRQSVVSVPEHDAGLSQAEARGTEARSTPPTLNPEQRTIVEAITPDLGRFAVHLLHGVTGSGKTEVYLHLLARLLDGDDRAGAVVLVPEIALTPQTSRRFLERFGPGTVAVLHSGLSSAQRHAQWAEAAAGRVRVVVGARSAVFAPLPRLGLVIVDEEHDTSYKQDQLPRYHARDAGIKRAQIEGCPVVLGSATPSLESWANAFGPGARYRLHRLTSRATGTAMPQVSIVDMTEERRRRAAGPGGWRDHHLHLLGPTLEGELDRTLAGGGQAILLLNRRGFANYICCPDARCGWVMRCDHCDVLCVYHRGASAARPGFVRCHHCLTEQLLPRDCPVCGRAVNRFGAGTQRLEEELERKFLNTRGLKTGDTLLRVDSDTMHRAHDYFDALDRFASGRVRVLLGTQMIAKGLDFPNVRLVGVVSADTSLNMPDYRAEERTFQLVAQVAGRAGRGAERGVVVVQTLAPENPAIVLASRHDFESFARRELEIRTRSSLPPITKMARIVCRDRLADRARAAADALYRALEEAAPEGVRLRTPAPCPLARLHDHHRVDILVLAASRGLLQQVLGAVRARGLLTSDAHTAVDVDPISSL